MVSKVTSRIINTSGKVFEGLELLKDLTKSKPSLEASGVNIHQN